MAYIIGAIGMFFIVLSYGQFSQRYPEAGSVYSYVSKVFGSHVGFIAGWVVMVDYILLPALATLISALWMEALTGIWMIVWALIFILFATIVNIRGIEITVKTAMALFIFEDLVLAAFIIAGFLQYS